MRFSSIRSLVLVCGAVGLTPCASAQSVNIEFGNGLSVPSPTYPGATGQRGVWNTFASMPTSQRFVLKGLDGLNLSTARIYNIGTTQLLSFDHPQTGGEDEKLLDEMYLSFNNPVDACFFFEGMRPGRYEVTLYAWTPNNTTLLSRARVDNSPQGPIMVGGAWPGRHAAGVTYASFPVQTADGRLGMHSGLFGGNIQSGVNGIQLRYLDACRADLTGGDLAGIPDGGVTIDDLIYFVEQYALGAMEVDLDNGTGTGVRDEGVSIDDLVYFITRFTAGC
jgi:hypothetical protein